MKLKKEWRFLSFRWWVVHFIGFTVIYTLGRLVSSLVGG